MPHLWKTNSQKIKILHFSCKCRGKDCRGNYNALKEYVNKIRKLGGDYDFKRFVFVRDTKYKEDLNIISFK